MAHASLVQFVIPHLGGQLYTQITIRRPFNIGPCIRLVLKTKRADQHAVQLVTFGALE